jgi:glycerol-3-phosphate acyltransferase PlsY
MLLFVFSYLVGSIPLGVIFSKCFNLKDVRKVGSGNIGATNVLRAGSKKAAFLTLVFDVAKGWLPVWLYLHFYEVSLLPSYFDIIRLDYSVMVIALFSIIGHIFPIWLKGKGGKGVSTIAGAYIAISPIFASIVFAAWIITMILSGISSLCALVSLCVVSPIIAIFCFIKLGASNFAIFSLICAGIIIFTHKENIRRLIAGTEPRSFKKSKKK